MERALDAYSIEHIDRYFEDVKRTGLTEHGFPRLASNIGTMLAHGRKQELRSRFVDMMSFCCEHVSTDRAANDFSIQEMLICIDGLEASGAIEKGRLASPWSPPVVAPLRLLSEPARRHTPRTYHRTESSVSDSSSF